MELAQEVAAHQRQVREGVEAVQQEAHARQLAAHAEFQQELAACSAAAYADRGRLQREHN